MSANENYNSQSSSFQSEQGNTSSSGFIDDYSQLRLSYYQHRGDISDISCGTSNTSSEFETIETNLSETTILDAKEVERQKLREYYISQIPELPHPSYVAASIISSAASKMGSVFRYNDRIEQGSQVPDLPNDMKFDPKRRSTLKPNEFPN
uniref:Uncharacterized protein n=1 Tax=Heliothis virescens TaxID=7102 RepID=A0A2A4J1T9_HELVI